MARYNRRDLFKHWIRREQRANSPCTHACCRGFRPHPEHYPLVMPARYLRGASDDTLARHYARCPEGNPRCRDQVLNELHRRDVRQERREAAEQRRTRRWADGRALRDAEMEREWLAAERETKVNMLNRRGREAGIDEKSLFRGPESRARKYASEELLNYWEDHPQPTEAYFRGEDTRLGMIGTRRRLTSAEQQERDWYEIGARGTGARDSRMNIADRLVVIRRDHGQVFVYDGPPGPGKLVESRCLDGSATDPWGNEAPTGDWRKDGLELPGGVRLGPIGFAYCVFCGALTAEGNPDGHNCPAGLLRRFKRFCQLARICGTARRHRPHGAGFDIEDAIEQLMRDLDDARGSDSPE